MSLVHYPSPTLTPDELPLDWLSLKECQIWWLDDCFKPSLPSLLLFVGPCLCKLGILAPDFSVVKRPVAFSKRFKGARRRRRRRRKRGRRADQTILSAAAGQGLLGQLLDRVVSQAHTPYSTLLLKVLSHVAAYIAIVTCITQGYYHIQHITWEKQYLRHILCRSSAVLACYCALPISHSLKMLS